MKIAVSSNGENLNDLMDARFGRCTYFQIYDTDTDEVKCIENKGQIANGGAGIAAAQQIVDENVNVVITGNLGPNAYNVLKGSEIEIYQCGIISVKDAVEQYKSNSLKQFTHSAPAHTGMMNGGRFRGGR